MAESSSAAPAWTAEPFVPDATSLRTLARAAGGCRGCPFYADATHNDVRR